MEKLIEMRDINAFMKREFLHNEDRFAEVVKDKEKVYHFKIEEGSSKGHYISVKGNAVKNDMWEVRYKAGMDGTYMNYVVTPQSLIETEVVEEE